MHDSRGNALFLILIAVALFAALSYAVTQSGRGGGSIDKEQNLIAAAQLSQAGAAFQSAVQRFSLTSGISPSLIKTGDNAPWTCCPGEPSDDFCTSGSDCLFAPEGGGMTIPTLPRAGFMSSPPLPIMSWASGDYFTGAGGFNGVEIQQIGVSGVGTAANDYTVSFMPLTEEVCQSINDAFGISGIPIGDGSGNVGGTATGELAACFNYGGGGDPQYTYYEVLVAN